MSGFAKYHYELSILMAGRKGETFTRAQVLNLFRKKFPDLRDDFVQPSDHCIDHICKEACECAKTEKAIFSRPKRNTYIVLR